MPGLKVTDPEVIALVAATATVVQATNSTRGWRRRKVDLNSAIMEQVEHLVEVTNKAHEPLRRQITDLEAKLAAAGAQLAEMRTAIDTLTTENAHLRSEVTLLRAGEFDRRHHDR